MFDFKRLNWIVTMKRAANLADGARQQFAILTQAKCFGEEPAVIGGIAMRAISYQTQSRELYERARELYADDNQNDVPRA